MRPSGLLKRKHMSGYLDLFPKVAYDINGYATKNYQVVTNLFFRMRVIRNVTTNIHAYYEYTIKDGDTPEILAEKVYGNPEAHWIILLANEIVDPQHGWPLDNRQFSEYIKTKYGSISNAKTDIHHYEMVITREDSVSGTSTTSRFEVNKEKLTDNSLDVPYDYYQGDGSLPETQEYNTYDIGNNKTVIEITKREAITNYDYEYELNEKKRNIKIILSRYYGPIMDEFNKMVGSPQMPYLRKIV